MQLEEFELSSGEQKKPEGRVARFVREQKEKRAAKAERSTVTEHVHEWVGGVENNAAFSEQFDATTVQMDDLKAKQEAHKLKANLESAIKQLGIDELEANLGKRIDRFFNKSAQYQAKHLDGFVNGLCSTIDRYDYPAYVGDRDDDEDKTEVKEHFRDAFANIGLALASLLIFYPIVLAATSYAKGQNFGFFRVHDGRNDDYRGDAHNRSEAKNALREVLPKTEELGEDSDQGFTLLELQ